MKNGEDESVGTGVVPADWDGDPIYVVFFIALEQPLAIPDGKLIYATRQQESVPWVLWNGGLNFVGLRVWRADEQEDLHSPKDDNALPIN